MFVVGVNKETVGWGNVQLTTKKISQKSHKKHRILFQLKDSWKILMSVFPIWNVKNPSNPKKIP